MSDDRLPRRKPQPRSLRAKSTEWGNWWSNSSDHAATFERIGNLWVSWIMWTLVLEDCAYRISGGSFLRRGSRETTMPLALAVRAMLMGYAIECALKARWLRNGNRLVVSGRFQNVPGVKHHDLLQLARVVGYAATPAERNVLGRLSKFALFAGRYPVATRMEMMLPHQALGLEKVDVGYFSRRDFRISQSILNKVIGLVSGKKRRAIGPPGSASYHRAARQEFEDIVPLGSTDRISRRRQIPKD
jgi:hypothetical protein